MKKKQVVRGLIQLIFLSLALTGSYFQMRKAFVIILLLGLVAGNFFCGWICPYGSLQELFSRIGDKLFKKKYKMPQKYQKYLQFSRYIILAIFMIESIRNVLLEYDSYKVFIKTFNDFSSVTLSMALIIMLSFLIISMVFERPFCNYLCVESFKFSLGSSPRIFTVKRDKEKCISCKKCDKVCPMNIEVSTKKKLRNIQCINCFKCTDSCPVDKTLTYGSIFKKKDK